jgi:hypothetical protein
MIEGFFAKGDVKQAKTAETTLRNAIGQVRNDQDRVLKRFNELAPKHVPVLMPATRWAQSKSHIFMEVKFATRFDSPACLDVYDISHQIVNTTHYEPA